MSDSTSVLAIACPRLVLLLIALASSSWACGRSPSAPAAPPVSADTWAVVDGREITRPQVENAYRRARDSSQTLSFEEEMTAKLSLLNELIIEDLLLAKAGTLKVELLDSELDTAYANAQKNIPPDAFQQELTRRGLTAADMREGLRRELLTQKVIDREVGSKVSVTDQEIGDFYAANRAQFNIAEESYRLAQIVVTPVRDAQLANRTGDDAATPEAAAAKVQMLMERLKAGASFGDLAVGYSEDPDSAPRGGDLGLVPMSRLKQAPPPLRNAVLNKAPGSVNVASAGGAYTIVAIIAHEAAGQRDLSTPGVRDGITATLRGRKEQLLRAAYLTSVQSDAQVVNYLARRLVESNGAMPTAPLLPPTAK
jgi:peptidyl-prolyl cis-trans isomerase SurA